MKFSGRLLSTFKVLALFGPLCHRDLQWKKAPTNKKKHPKMNNNIEMFFRKVNPSCLILLQSELLKCMCLWR